MLLSARQKSLRLLKEKQPDVNDHVFLGKMVAYASEQVSSEVLSTLWSLSFFNIFFIETVSLILVFAFIYFFNFHHLVFAVEHWQLYKKKFSLAKNFFIY